MFKLTIKTPERRHWRRFGVFIVNSEHISHLFLVILLLNLNKYMLVGRGACQTSKTQFCILLFFFAKTVNSYKLPFCKKAQSYMLVSVFHAPLFKINNKDTRTTSTDVLLMSMLLMLTKICTILKTLLNCCVMLLKY